VGFSARHLNEGERIVVHLNPHWSRLVGPFVTVVVALVLVVVSGDIAPEGETGWMRHVEWLAVRASWLLVAIATIWSVQRLVQWSTTNFVVTNHRVVFAHGIIARERIDIPIRRVNNVNFRQSMFERILGAGDLLIESGGETGQSRFSDIRDPEQVQNIIQRVVREYEDDDERGSPEA
jgi:uncharacterized membrane protein YdbT with pleckstrin-like domain